MKLMLAMLLPNLCWAYIDPSTAPLTNEKLQSRLSNHPTKITSLDELPALLPEEFRMNLVLKHGIKRTGPRGHLVETIVSQSADPHLPRAILWDERNGYSLSYNGGSVEQTGAHRLDVLRFKDQDKTFILETVDFPLKTPGKLVFEKDTECLSCHGPHGRPIFSMYPDWPSFYGSDNDELLADTESQEAELSDYTNFFHKTAPFHPRYRPLFDSKIIKKRLGVDMYPTYPFRYDLNANINDPSRAFAFRPGLRMGILYNRLMALHLSARIQEHSNFARFGKFFLYNLLQCGNVSTDTTKTRKEIKRAVDEAKKINLSLNVKTNELVDYRSMLSLVGMKVNDVDMRFSYNHRGYQNTDASRDVMGIGYIGNYFNSYFDGSATIDELLAAQLYSYYSERHPGLKNKVNLRGLTEKYSRFSERMRHDKLFFASMDEKSKWIPIPYPSSISAVHHREIYRARFREEHRALCGTLEGMLWWPTRP